MCGTTVWTERGRDLVGRQNLLLVDPCLTADDRDGPLEAAAAAEATGVVVKGSGQSLGDRANELGIALLEVDGRSSLEDVELLVRGRIAAAGAGEPAGPVDTAGLYELARVTATLLGAPVEITDEHFRTLAFDNLSFPIDELRERSILDRRPPAATLEWLSRSGMFDELRESRDPVHIDPPGGWPRLVAALRGQRQHVLGYVCVTQADRRFGAHDARVLADAAFAMAQHQAAGRYPARAATKSSEALLADVLAGTADVSALTRRLSRARGTRWHVVGLQERRGRYEPDLRQSVSAKSVLPEGVVTELDGRVYVAVECEKSGTASELAARVASNASAHTGRDIVACAGDPITDGHDVVDIRRAVDRGLDVLMGESRRASATVTELRASLLLVEIGELVHKRPHLLSGPLDCLVTGRTRRSADYLSSLSVYLRCGCDVGAAARRLFIHRNTLRYRLNRVQELCQIDLEDPTERFVVELQLRLLELGDRVAHSAGTEAREGVDT
ncbi:PucR family transcriptional regulator [Haloechinothrix alba]|uniref:PucR family transcriptional regulator n=1 Tax=Haloechinothrix alba TaxID=664784 RepID=UPI0015953407|nr:helix-turn-helix domain-containing protein [Haloechinothrix alba]